MRPAGWLVAFAAGAMIWTCGGRLSAQLSVRSHDPSGLSGRLPRVRVIHSDTPRVSGTSMHLQVTDPWLAYKIGASYFQHEWNVHDGVFTAFVGRPFAEGVSNSCGMCHSIPFRTPGAGGNVAEPGAFGRNVPSLFGIGIVETLAQQARALILAKYDTNRNGFLDVPDEVTGKEAVIEATPGVTINFGALDDRTNGGFPGLNDVVRVAMVDRNGMLVRSQDGKAVNLKSPGVAGYDIAVSAIASSTIIDQEPTIRLFFTNAMRIVLGLAVNDHTITNNSGTGRDLRAGDMWAETSNAGARQLISPLVSRADDSCHGISEGEIDLIEWYLMNHPAPAQRARTERTRRGRELLRNLECTKCHVENWRIHAADDELGLPGDRRFFHLDVAEQHGRLEGHLQMSTVKIELPDGTAGFVPRRAGFDVEGIYSDLLYHDLGSRFHEFRSVGGKLVATYRFRTAPLWGAGSTAPYGHDGRSLSLDDVIRRHGGEAEESSARYRRAAPEDREAVIAFLRSLVLFQTDQLPADLNGDGKIDAMYHVSTGDAGPERFEPELLFRRPPEYRGWVNRSDGDRYFSFELLNANEAYRRTSEALIDSDGDGLPDIAGCESSMTSLKR